jgi:hypothetical protein
MRIIQFQLAWPPEKCEFSFLLESGAQPKVQVSAADLAALGDFSERMNRSI